MFSIRTPLPEIEARARRNVYREYLKMHSDLTAISVGCHNDMIILAKNDETEEAVAILLATGSPGERVVFPKHRHMKGERTTCLEGHYGEYLESGDDANKLFEQNVTLEAFQQAYPGVIEILEKEGDRTPVKLGPGAEWSMANETEHKPFGWIGENGILLAQIYWGGHNDITEPPAATPPSETTDAAPATTPPETTSAG